MPRGQTAAGRGRGRGRAGGARPGRAGSGVGRGRGRGRGGQSVGEFLAPRTGRQAGAVANAAASAEYNPEIRQLRQQAKGSRKREADVRHWFDELATDYDESQAAGMAALQAAGDATSKQLSEAADRDKAQLGELSAQDEQFAKLVGGPKDTSGLSKIAQAGAAAERARVSLAAPIAQERANYVASLGGQKTAARLQGIEERKGERNRRDKILNDLGGVRREKGAARVARKEDIRTADRDYALQLKQLRLARKEANSAAQQAAADAAIAQVEAAREARQDAISNRQSQERIGISAKNAATSARSQRATARNYRNDNKGGLSTAEKRARGEHSSDAMSAAKAQLAIKVPKTPKQWAQFEAALIEKLGSSYSAEAARAVAKLRQQQAPPPVPYAPTPKGRRAARRARSGGRKR